MIGVMSVRYLLEILGVVAALGICSFLLLCIRDMVAERRYRRKQKGSAD